MDIPKNQPVKEYAFRGQAQFAVFILLELEIFLSGEILGCDVDDALTIVLAVAVKFWEIVGQ